MIEPLSDYLRGWRGYFGFCQTPSVLADLDSWLRRRLRCLVLNHWPRGKRRFVEMTNRGVSEQLAAQTAASCHGPWRLSRSPALSFALPNHFRDRLGVERLLLKK